MWIAGGAARTSGMVKTMRARTLMVSCMVCAFAWSAVPVSAAAASATFSDIDETPGVTGGEGTHFQITDSDYLDISLDSTETVKLRLSSVPSVITMMLEPSSSAATSTQITITGLVPDTPYYKYEDSLHNLSVITSDENGTYSYAQDLSRHHRIFIQPRKSTKFISADATGGDCASMGVWDPATLTCTLTTDVTTTIEIDSDGVTLDGGGHTLDGESYAVDGVYLDERTGVTIRNLVIKDFSYGVDLYGSSGNRIEDNTFVNDDSLAIDFYSSDANVISGNTVTLTVPSDIRHQGFVLYDSRKNSFQGDTIALDTQTGTGSHQGILLFDSDGNGFTAESISGVAQGILLFDAKDNVFHDDIIEDTKSEGFMIYSPSSGNRVYHNDFIRNGKQPIDYGGAGDAFSLPPPEGGNYWDAFDDPAEGCSDANHDDFCDAPYDFSGGQDASPWTTQDGWNAPPKPKVSNVLFLPGIEGSRLFEGTGCSKAAEEKLWEPLDDSSVNVVLGAGDGKVKDLALDPSGASACADIYAKEGDVIDTIRGSDLYASLESEMDGLTSGGTINDWEPVAYDWRLSLDDLLANGAERDGKIYYGEATDTPYIEQTLRALAASSKTGKVTIVAHSNGGLVAKALLKKLGDDAPSLVDKVIMVGAPQNGAPYDIGAMLVGDDAGIYRYHYPIVSNAAARAFTQDSPMAYHLLPSEDYLESTMGDRGHPVVRFSGDGYAKEEAAYGSTIANRVALDDFLLAKDDGREKPAWNDLASAEILNPALIDYANSAHASLDAWMPPPGIEVDQVAGWGVDTVGGIDFYSGVPAITGPLAAVDGSGMDIERLYRPILIEDGDGTVPAPSALMMASSTNVKRYWLDLSRINNVPGVKVKRSHGDLFEVPQIQDFIKNSIENSTSTLPAYISSEQPAPQSAEKKLTFFLHSPLTLQLADASGNVTGLAADGSVTEDIPGSAYGEFGEVKYLTAPEGGRYQLAMHGQDSGSFSLDIQESSSGVIIASSTIAGVPTTSNTLATMTITGGIGTASALTIDENGDGKDVLAVNPEAGKTVRYEPPIVAPPPPARAAGGPGYSPYKPVEAVPAASSTQTVPVIPDIAETTTIVASTTPVATTTGTEAVVASWGAPAPVTRRVVTRTVNTPPAPPIATDTRPDLSQTASVYNAVSYQSVMKAAGRRVYTGLYRLWIMFVSLF